MDTKRVQFRLKGHATKEKLDVSKRSRYIRLPYLTSQNIKNAWTVATEYSRNSTIHGLSYLTEKRRHWSERCFWLLTWTALVVACCCTIIASYHDWQSSPVVLITVDEEPAHVFQSPFPAVTICPENRFYDLDLIEMNRIFKCNAVKGCFNDDEE